MGNGQAAPLTIVQLTATDRPVGPGKQIIHQSLCLPALGITPVIVTFAVGPEEIGLLIAAAARGLAAERLESSFSWDPRTVARLLRLLRRRSARALVTHGYKANLVGLLAARPARIPIIAFARGWTDENRRVRLYHRLDRHILKRMDAVVAVSQAKHKELVALGLDPARVVTIANAVDLDGPGVPSPRAMARRRLELEFSLSPEADIVATAGRLSREKAQADFLHACAQVASRHPRARFLIFGEGVERGRLTNLVRDLSLSERVVFCGHRTDFPVLLPGVDLFVLSSLSEGLPNVILEAFAAGVPVVATEVGGIPELAQGSVTALMVPPAAPEQLALAIHQVLQDRPAAARRAAAARALVTERYSFADNARQFAELVRRVVSRPDVRDLSPGEEA